MMVQKEADIKVRVKEDMSTPRCKAKKDDKRH